jgi:hypothetical protein
LPAIAPHRVPSTHPIYGNRSRDKRYFFVSFCPLHIATANI